MKILSWNCQGLGNPRTVRTLQSWCWRDRPNIVFLMETMVDAKKLKLAQGKCGFSEGLCLSSRGLSGGIGFWWRDINVHVRSYSAHHVTAEIRDNDNEVLWTAVGIYGWPEQHNKHLTWALMKEIRGLNMGPIIFFGDFNEILYASEKEGGAVRREYLMDAFRETVDVCGVQDLGFKGVRFTWKRGNEEGSMIRERLDRFLASDDWGAMFPHSSVRNFPIYKSDHAPILLETEIISRGRGAKKRFHFEAIWLSKPECHEVVKRAWVSRGNDTMAARIEGCSSALSGWAATTFGAIKKRIKLKEEELELWQGRVADGVMIAKCKEITGELDELQRLHESYWFARARANEMRDGDKNTAYFHHKASQRKQRNRIQKLQDGSGEWKTDEGDIGQVIAEYFDDLFSTSHPSNVEAALRGIETRVSAAANELLLAEPTGDEIRTALFQMHPNKAPGIDGMHALFYQKFWHVVGEDVINFIKSWWCGATDIDSLNRTCIVLIPKCPHPQQMGDFRPISLCNVLYKIVSKMMANRLKILLPDIISKHQSAFVPGRLITDNAMVAFEIFHGMKRRSEGRMGTMAFKLDMSKAYDRVEWSFVEKIMLKMGFNTEWVDRIMLCLSSVTYSYKLNGRVEGNIIPSRGLRQGDPLSPYLFLLCAEGFSSLLARAADEGFIHGARVCRQAPRISHLFFADDSILFTRATLQECSVVADILSTYERASGQKINFNKSEVSFSRNVESCRKNEILTLFGVREVERHEKYLGLPTVIGRSKKMVFAVLKERVWKKLQGWKEKLLSRAGKEVLLKAVIQSIPTYMMSLFAIPDCVLNEINSLCARFWWGARNMERKMHWVSWEKLCLPKSHGGMGFRDLRVFNQALLAKQGWRLLCDTGSLVHKVLSARYYPHGEFLEARRGFDPSFIWRSIWGAKSLLLEGLKWRVGNGEHIQVWHDAWLPGDSSSLVPTPNMESPADLRVAELIDTSGEWDATALATHFTEEDARLIRELPLSKRQPVDVMFWWPATDGVYSTKSGYWLGRLGHIRGWHDRFGGDNGDSWRAIWNLGGPPKLAHFIWRACTGALATRGRLMDRHIIEDGRCPHCNEGKETIVHTIFFCSLVKSIWESSSFLSYIAEGPRDSFMSMFAWLKSKLDVNGLLEVMALAWGAWSYRNSVVHSEPWHNIDVGVAGFLRLVMDYRTYATAVHFPTQYRGVISRASWIPPGVGSFKLNTDVAMLEEGTVGVGAVVRDCTGRVMLVGVRRYQARWKAALGEAIAARFGIQLARQYGFGVIEMEGDAYNLSKAVALKKGGRSTLDLIVEDIWLTGESLESFSFSHVKRGGNTVAHFIARLYPSNGVEQMFVDNFPQGVLALADMDVS